MTLLLVGYVHLNPVRGRGLGLGKSARSAARAGAATAPESQQVRERIGRLRAYRWSSYRAYIGSGPTPGWLTCDVIGQTRRETRKEQWERYRDYVETALREGLETGGFWGELKEGTILGSDRFVQRIRDRLAGDRQEQRAASRLRRERVEWGSVVAAAERVKGESWERFRDRHGDGTRDMVLYLARRRCGLKLRELEARSGLASYGAVAMAIKRYELRLADDEAELARLNKVTQMLNVKM